MQDIKRSVGVLIYFIFYIYLPLFYRFFKKSGAKNIMFKLTTYNIEIICILNYRVYMQSRQTPSTAL